MLVESHRLVGVPFVATPNMGGALRAEVAVIHYTVSWPGSAVVRAFESPSVRASAHLVLDLDGSLTQMVPFDRVAWHAGQSSWKGRPGLNGWSLGIEIVNPGPVFPGAGGRATDVNGRAWAGGYERADKSRLPPQCPPGWVYWATYTEPQYDALERVCRALVRHYGLTEIIGHSDVSPGRKFDPGPMLDMGRIRAAAFAQAPDTEPAPPPSQGNPLGYPTLSEGTSGWAVVELQRRLAGLAVDGQFGPRTRAAVIAYQQSRALTPDGIVGPKTWRTLTGETL